MKEPGGGGGEGRFPHPEARLAALVVLLARGGNLALLSALAKAADELVQGRLVEGNRRPPAERDARGSAGEAAAAQKKGRATATRARRDALNAARCRRS